MNRLLIAVVALVLIAGGVGIGFALSGSEGTPAASAAPSESSAGAATPDEGAVGSDADVGADDGEGVAPVTPITPSVPTMEGEMDGDTRVFQLTASEFTQQIANFPLKTAKVWGYSESTPGPTLLINEGEKVRVEITNELPPTDPMGPDKGPGPHATATTVHFHGLHHPNSEDGVAGISQPDPIEPGATYTYEFTPEHAGTFAYHSHTEGAVQDLRGLDGMIVVQPESVNPETAVDVDVVMTLQQFAPPSEGALVDPFPPGTGAFPFSTINGKTSEAAGEAIDIEEGDRVRIRFYNASNNAHSMHLHGHDFVVTSKNGHPIPLEAQNEETTQNISPGDFYEIEWTADNPGNWIFHCHFPHHTANKMLSGWHGAPVGMARIFHYEGFEDVRQEYFDYQGPEA